MRGDGVTVREGRNLCLIPLILESLLIIGSSFHHLANPEACHSALRGSRGAGGRGGGRKTPSEENRTRTHSQVHTSSFGSIKEKEITSSEKR